MTEVARTETRSVRATSWIRGGPGTGDLSAGILREYVAAMSSYRLPKRELKRLQERKLQKLISFVFDRVPYYHDVMKTQGLVPRDISQVEDLQKLPLLTKGIILARPANDLLARGITQNDEKTTSGTTGPPVTFYRGPMTERRIVALRLRRRHMTGMHWWEKEAYVTYSGRDPSHAASMRRINLATYPIDARDLVAGYREIVIGPRNAAAVARLLVRYKPSILRGRPSYLRRLAGFVKEYDRSFAVRRIITEGEVLTKGTREDLRSIYGGEVFDQYGCIEFPGMGAECRSHNGTHLSADYFVFEFLARDGQPASEGERAELVVTGLADDAMPLIRYSLGDIVIKDTDDACPCGCALPRLKQIDGRASDGLVTAHGDFIPPNPIVEYFESTLGLRNFQLVQEGGTELLLTVDGRLSEKIAESVREYVSLVLGGEVSIRTESWKNEEMPIKFRPVMMSAAFANSLLRPTSFTASSTSEGHG
jgi:phenylacetate-CoA ligase